MRDGAGLLTVTAPLDTAAAQQVAAHRMPFWTERMTLSWLRNQAAHGARAQARGRDRYDLVWPDGHQATAVTFSRTAASEAGLTLLTIEDARVRGLTTRLPTYAPGLPVTALSVPGISEKVTGFWSLWRIGLQTDTGREQRILPIFVTRAGQVLAPTARVIWDRLVELADGVVVRPDPGLTTAETQSAFEHARAAAEEQGTVLFHELAQRHRERLDQERRKMVMAFAARRRSVERLGLPQVRTFRLAQIDRDEAAWRLDLARREPALADLGPLLLVAIVNTLEAG